MGPADQDSSLLARPAVGHRQHYGGDIVRLGLDRRPHTDAPPKTPLARPVSSAAELRHGGVPAPAVSGAFSAPHLTPPIQLRSEERRVGKECRYRGVRDNEQKRAMHVEQ